MDYSLQITSKKSWEFHKEYPTISPIYLHELAIDIIKLTINQLDGSLNNNIADKLISSMNQLIKSNDLTKKQLEQNQALLNAEYKNQLIALNTQKMDEIKKTIDENTFTKTNSIIAIKDTKLDEALNQINQLLKKFENSSSKGIISENIMYDILKRDFSSDQVEYVSKDKKTCDFKLIREGKPIILIENKSHDTNVPNDEIAKFIRDIDHCNYSGILLSHLTGLCGKKNFQIDIHKGNVIVYIHRANYDVDIIKNAINIIDYVKLAWNELDIDKDNTMIEKDILNEINKEFQQAMQQKQVLTKCVKDFQTKIQKEIDDIKLPSLHELLTKYFAFSVDGVICKYCNKMQKNQSALSAHLRGNGDCATKKQSEENLVKEKFHIKNSQAFHNVLASFVEEEQQQQKNNTNSINTTPSQKNKNIKRTSSKKKDIPLTESNTTKENEKNNDDETL